MKDIVKLNILKGRAVRVFSTIDVIISLSLLLSASLLLCQLHVLALFTTRNFLCLAELVIDCLHDLVKDCI